MKLNKRLYLLTPILVICCILAAGIYVDKPDNVVADNAAVVLANDDTTVYEKGNYNPLTMEQVINASGTDKYEIANFDVNLFDYNGDAWNAFSAYQFLDDGFFMFRHGGINQYTSYELKEDGKHPLIAAPLSMVGVNIFGEWGVNQNIRGIVQPTLINGYPSFTTGVGNDGLAAGSYGFREQMLFNPSKIEDFYGYSVTDTNIADPLKDQLEGDWGGYAYKFDANNDDDYEDEGDYNEDTKFDLDTIRTAYKGSFQFLYDTTTGYYTYDSAKNHAQFEATELKDGIPNDNDGNGSIDGEVVLYADTLATTNYAADISDMLAMYDYYDTISGERPNYGDGGTVTRPYYGQGNYGENRENDSNMKNDAVYTTEAQGIWTLYEDTSANYWDDVSGVKKFHLWQTNEDAANNFFAPALKFNDFKIRINNNTYHSYTNAPMIDTFSTTDVEYIYVKFKVNGNVPANADLRFQLVYQGKDNDGGLNLNNSGYNPDDAFIDEATGKFVSGKYEAGKWVELYIPTEDWTENEISALSIVPFYVPQDASSKPFVADGGKDEATYNNVKANAVDFWIQDLCLVYNLLDDKGNFNEKPLEIMEVDEYVEGADEVSINNTSVIHTNSNFLPFHKIQNSYIGFGRDNSYYSEITDSYSMSDGYTKADISEDDANSILDKWAGYNSVDSENKRSQYANRSVSNVAYGQYSGGLGALGTNDYGGTASHFGMSMEVDFYIPADKTTGKDIDGDGNNESIVFEFLGDDDLWVFVDGQLLLDLGGCHPALAGKINFTEGTVEYFDDDLKKLTTINTDGTVNTEAIQMSQTIAADICKPGYHKLQIFYLERGSGVSNCYISFNLPQVPVGGVHVSKDVECELSKKDENNNDLQYSVNGEAVNAFQKDDFFGKLYDFKIAYSILEDVTDWNSEITSALEYTLYQTDKPENKAGPFYTSPEGVFSVPAGWTACISVPESIVVDNSSQPVKSVYVIELGESSAGGSNSSSDKVYSEDWLPGNYEYSETTLKHYYLSTETAESNVVDVEAGLPTGEIFASKEYRSISDPIFFKFTNYYTWQIEFDTESDTEISSGDKSTTLDIDEDVKVKFENQPNKENWLDGENNQDNKFNY